VTQRLHPATVALVLVLPLAFLGVAVAANLITGVPFGDISREPQVTLDGPALVGIQSNLGVLLMWTATSVSLFAYSVLRRRPVSPVRPTYFLWAGLISGLLGLDDLLLLHDDIIIDVLGVHQRLTMLAYAGICVLFALAYRRTILGSSSLPLLVLAVFMLAGSIAIDQTSKWWADPNLRIFFEDGSKLIGITAWTAFFTRDAFYAVSAVSDRSASGDTR